MLVSWTHSLCAGRCEFSNDVVLGVLIFDSLLFRMTTVYWSEVRGLDLLCRVYAYFLRLCSINRLRFESCARVVES